MLSGSSSCSWVSVCVTVEGVRVNRRRGRDSGSRDARQQIASSPSLLLQSFSMIHPVKPRGESRCCVSRESLSPSSLVKGSTARESDCGSRGLTV